MCTQEVAYKDSLGAVECVAYGLIERDVGLLTSSIVHVAVRGEAGEQCRFEVFVR